MRARAWVGARAVKCACAGVCAVVCACVCVCVCTRTFARVLVRFFPKDEWRWGWHGVMLLRSVKLDGFTLNSTVGDVLLPKGSMYLYGIIILGP